MSPCGTRSHPALSISADEERAFLKLIIHEPCQLDERIRESGLATTTASVTLMELTGSYVMG